MLVNYPVANVQPQLSGKIVDNAKTAMIRLVRVNIILNIALLCNVIPMTCHDPL